MLYILIILMIVSAILGCKFLDNYDFVKEVKDYEDKNILDDDKKISPLSSEIKASNVVLSYLQCYL